MCVYSDSSIFNFGGTSILFYIVTIPIYIPHQQGTRIPFSPQLCQNLLLVSLMTTIPIGMHCWYLIVVLICISLIISDVEYLIMYLLVIWIPSLEKYSGPLPFFFFLLLFAFIFLWHVFPSPKFLFLKFLLGYLFLLCNLLFWFRNNLFFSSKDHLNVAGRAHVGAGPTMSSLSPVPPHLGGFVHLDVLSDHRIYI